MANTVIQMKSGSDNAYPVSTSKRVLLWTNPDPGSLAETTIYCDMEGCDEVEIECTNTGNPDGEVYYVREKLGTDTIGRQTYLTSVFLNTNLSGLNSIGIMTRIARCYLHGIWFSSGMQIYDGTLYTGWNNRAVPYRVWGIHY